MISIIVPTCRDLKKIDGLILSIFQQKELPSLEVIIVYNSPRFPPIVPDFLLDPRIRVISIDHSNVNRARNIGLHHSSGEIIFFFDDDVILDDPQLVSSHLRLHNELADVLAIGGSYKPKGLNDSNRFSLIGYDDIQRDWVLSAHAHPWRLVGGHVSYKAGLLPSKIIFDESIDFGSAETHANLRLFNQGYKLSFQPSLSVVHDYHLPFKNFIYKALKQGRSLRRLTELKSEEIQGKSHRVYDFFFNIGHLTRAPIQKSYSSYLGLFLEFLFRKLHDIIFSSIYSDRTVFVYCLLYLNWVRRFKKSPK